MPQTRLRLLQVLSLSLQHDLVLYGDDFCDGGVGDLEELGKKLNGRKILLVEAIRQMDAAQS